jgi:hypothetical protein
MKRLRSNRQTKLAPAKPAEKIGVAIPLERKKLPIGSDALVCKRAKPYTAGNSRKS